MNHLKNSLENNILPNNLEDLKNEIREKIALIENKTVPKKVTKFVKTVTLKLQKANLKKFFKTGSKLRVNNFDFQEFLKDALIDCDEALEKDATYHWHANTATTHDNVIWPEIGQETIDMNTKEGLVEARDRLNYLRTEIENQSKGQSGTLLNNGYANVIGIFKLKSGRVLTVYAGWHSGYGQWLCRGNASQWNGLGRFLSCNGVA